MKKIILLALTALMMVGCNKDKIMPDGTYRNDGSSYRTYIIDSCEYFGILNRGNANLLSHKGNCRFCKERRQKEMEELAEQIKER